MANFSKLFPYQKEDVSSMIRMNGNFINASDVGTGKSCEVIQYAFFYKQYIRPMLIICLSSLKYNWENELKIWLDKPEETYIINKPLSDKEKERVKNSKIVIVNYDMLFVREKKKTEEQKKEEFLKYGFVLPTDKKKESWSDFLQTVNFQFLVCDEAQAIKNPYSSRAKEVIKLARNIPHVGVLTATPIENNPADLWIGLHLINPDEFPNYKEFARTYSNIKKGFRGEEQYEGGNNLHQLHEITKRYIIRHKKEDVLPFLPPLIKQVLPVQINNYNSYSQSENDFFGWGKQHDIRKERIGGLAKLEKLRQEVAKGKLPEVFDFVDNFLNTSSEKLIIFAHHKEIISKIYERYSDVSVKIVGGMDAKERFANVQKIQDKSSKVRIAVCNLKAAGTGLTLTGSSCTLFVELLYNPALIYQALNRNHRIGQTEKVHAYYMIGRNTVEEKMIRILDRKSNIASQVLDDEEMMDTDLLEILLKEAA